MTDKVQKIREEVERRMNCFKNERNTLLKASDNNLSLGARIAMCEEILSFIDSMQEEPVSEDLEKEVNKYFHALYSGWTDEQRKEDFLVEELCTNVARHFANWQKEQMMNGAIELPLYLDGDFLTIDYDFTESGFKVGDKVKLIIIKEE